MRCHQSFSQVTGGRPYQALDSKLQVTMWLVIGQIWMDMPVCCNNNRGKSCYMKVTSNQDNNAKTKIVI